MRTTTAKPDALSVAAFPAKAIAECLSEELVGEVKAALERKGEDLPAGKLTHLPIFIDSLSVVETLCVLDDVLPFSVDESVVRAGGYDSIEAAVNDVVTRIEGKWNEHHTGAKK
jgi:hypothetical protein